MTLCAPCLASGLAILPVRYAPVPNGIANLPQWANDTHVTSIALGAGYNYALRTMRAGYFYIYLPKSADGANVWNCYTVSHDGFFLKQINTGAMLPPVATPICARHGTDNTGLSYVVIAKPEKCQQAYLLFSESKLSYEALKQYEGDASLRDARMQLIEPASMVGGSKAKSGEVATESVVAEVIDYAPKLSRIYAARYVKLPDNTSRVAAISTNVNGDFSQLVLEKLSTIYAWSPRSDSAAKTIKHMQTRSKKKDGSAALPHIVAVHDAIGTVHELNGWMNEAAGRLKQYSKERELELYAMSAIEGVKVALKDKAAKNADANSGYLTGYHQGALDPDLYRRRQDAEFALREDKNKVKYDKEMASIRAVQGKRDAPAEEIIKTNQSSAQAQHYKSLKVNHSWDRYKDNVSEPKLTAFKANVDKLGAAVQVLTDKRAVPLLAWLQAPLFISTLEDFHQQNIYDGILFEQVIGDAIGGLNAATQGAAKLEQWVSAKATDKKNIVWRAIGLNQKDALAELDVVIADAIKHRASMTSAEAWNWYGYTAKSLKAFASAYKTANSVVNDRETIATKGDAAFQVKLKDFNARGTDKLMVSAGDAVTNKFAKINTLGDLVSEKIIQHVFCIRAYVAAADSEALITAQAHAMRHTRTSILKEMRRAKRLQELNPKVFYNAETDKLKNAWTKFKDSDKGPKAIKDARLAGFVGVFELLNFAKLLHDCKEKGDIKSQALLLASAMTIMGAVLDVASIPAKVLETLPVVTNGRGLTTVTFLGKPSFTYQTLKAWGGGLASGATLIGAVFDGLHAISDFKKENTGSFILYTIKTSLGFGAGTIGVLTSFTYSAQLISKIPKIKFFIAVESLEAGAAVTGSKLAIKIIGRRILLMTVGAWLSVGVFVAQMAIWIFIDNKLEDWLDKTPFAEKPGKPFITISSMQNSFEDAIADVGI